MKRKPPSKLDVAIACRLNQLRIPNDEFSKTAVLLMLEDYRITLVSWDKSEDWDVFPITIDELLGRNSP